MRREERVTVQGPVKEQQPDGMSHRGVKLCRPEVKLSKHEFMKKNFQKIFTKFYLVSTTFYQILLSVTWSGTKFYQIPPPSPLWVRVCTTVAWACGRSPVNTTTVTSSAAASRSLQVGPRAPGKGRRGGGCVEGCEAAAFPGLSSVPRPLRQVREIHDLFPSVRDLTDEEKALGNEEFQNALLLTVDNLVKINPSFSFLYRSVTLFRKYEEHVHVPFVLFCARGSSGPFSRKRRREAGVGLWACAERVVAKGTVCQGDARCTGTRASG